MNTLKRIVLVCTLIGLVAVFGQNQPSPAVQDWLNKSMERPVGSAAELAQFREDSLAQGISEQMLLEYEAYLFIQGANFIEMKSLRDRVQRHIPMIETANTLFMDKKEEWQALVSMLDAELAIESGDESAYKNKMLEAFWLSPKNVGMVVGQRVEERRKQETLGTTGHDLTRLTLSEAETNTAKTLAEVMGGSKKAILLDFWATWCGPCVKLMPELFEKAAHLPTQGIAVAAVNIENTAAAKRFMTRLTADFAKVQQSGGVMNWMADTHGLADLFEVQSIPQVVLLSREGKILFQGHPASPALSVALDKLLPKS